MERMHHSIQSSRVRTAGFNLSAISFTERSLLRCNRHFLISEKTSFFAFGAIAGEKLTKYLQSGVDCAVIALWLGHESMDTTQIYLHASLKLKEQVLEKTKSTNGKLGCYRPDDNLMAFLKRL